MSKIYAIEVTRILQETFYVEAESVEKAEQYGLRELAHEVDEEVETKAESQFEMDSVDEIPEVGAEVIKVS